VSTRERLLKCIQTLSLVQSEQLAVFMDFFVKRCNTSAVSWKLIPSEGVGRVMSPA